MDTNQFIYTEDFYTDVREDVDIRFDTSDYNKNNPYKLLRVNKKVVGFMKDENCGGIPKYAKRLRHEVYSMSTYCRRR